MAGDGVRRGGQATHQLREPGQEQGVHLHLQRRGLASGLVCDGGSLREEHQQESGQADHRLGGGRQRDGRGTLDEREPGGCDTYHGSIIEVCKKGQDKWTPYIADELKSGDDEQQLPNLKKGVEYEARGQYYQTDNGDTVYAPYGEIVPFTVPSDIDTMNCADDLPALTDCGDAQPKEIHPGDTIIANGKRVFVDSVSYSGDRLSGSGHLDFPIIKFFKFRMQFKNIKVNCAGELVDGEITSTYDMTNAFILDLNNLTGKGNTGDETFNSTEPTVGKVKDLDNAKKTKQPGDYFEVEGEPNTIYSLDKDKNPVKIGTKLANWTSDTFTHANKMYNSEILLKFSNNRKDQGFDSSEEPYRLMAPSKYESVDGYWIPWLASNPGRVCVVKAKLEGGSISNVKDPEHDVKFVMPLSDGGLMELNTQYKGSGEFEITVMGSSKAGDKLEIYAVIKKTDGKNEEYVDAGRLYVPIYEYRTLKMTVVKVNGANASAVDKSSIESYLNEVYGRIGISFEVTVEEFQSEEAKAFLEDGLDVCGAGGFMTATTDEMRQLKRLYMDSKGGSVDEKRLYLFLVNKAQCSEEDSKIDPSAVCGDMPRNSKVGYMFAENAGDQASFNRTVAHELGHGAFSYEHPFDNAAYKTEQGTTHNLMDYVKDDELAYFQWQSTLGLNLTWGFLEGDEDGMLFGFKFGEEYYNWFLDFFGGRYDDPLETKVNVLMKLLDHIYEKYDQYYGSTSYEVDKKTGKGKSEDTNVTLEDFKEWSVRGFAHKGTICQNIYKKFLSKQTETISLHEKGIFLESYTMKLDNLTTEYKVAVYSFKESFSIDPSIIKENIEEIDDIADSKRIKVACDKRYGLLAFYGDDGDLQMVIQMWNTGIPSPKVDALSWINYLAIMVNDDKPSETTTDKPSKTSDEKTDADENKEDFFAKIKREIASWFSSDELPEVWGEENETIDNKKRIKLVETAVADVIELRNNDIKNPACNICTRTAFYYLTGDPVLFPKMGAKVSKDETIVKGEVSGDGMASDIISDLRSGSLKAYFEEITKKSDEDMSSFWKRLQDVVNDGGCVVGTYKTTHVFLIVPGEMWKVVDNKNHTDGNGHILSKYSNNPNIEEGDKYGYSYASRGIQYVNRIVECGNNIKSGNAPIYGNMDYRNVIKNVKWYKYKKDGK